MTLIESQLRPGPIATADLVVSAPAYELAQFFDFARDLFCIVGLVRSGGMVDSVGTTD